MSNQYNRNYIAKNNYNKSGAGAHKLKKDKRKKNKLKKEINSQLREYKNSRSFLFMNFNFFDIDILSFTNN